MSKWMPDQEEVLIFCLSNHVIALQDIVLDHYVGTPLHSAVILAAMKGDMNLI